MVRINAILPEDTLVKIDAIAKEKKKSRQVERCFRGQKVEGITQMGKFTEI